MSDKAKEDMIDNFVNITSVDKDRARFYLESSAWNLELAMASFYEGDPDDDNMMAEVPSRMVSNPVPERRSPSPPTASSGSAAMKRKPATKKNKNTTSSRFATIGSMNQESDSDSEEEGQAFYAGGSETSGQQILGPKRDKKDKKNVVEDLFKSAKEHGAEEVGSDDPGQSRAPRPTFRGSGYRLGETENQDSEMIQGGPVMQTKKQVDCVLKLWKDGFSVNDGPLRDFKDPENRDFLNAISKGEVPQELIREARGGEVNLNMEDHRTEDYVKPKVSLKAFSGEGHTLGSPVPTVIASTSAPSSKAPASSLKVDDSKPTTTIQLRLADGSRLVSKFNHSHRVSDIRSHITQSRPQYAGVDFVLQTTFPNRELTNESETIEQAKLMNAVVVQRLK